MVSCWEFIEEVDEMFDIQLSRFSSAMISEPDAIKDGDNQIWSLPATRQSN